MNDEDRIIDGLTKVWDAFHNMGHELYANYVAEAIELIRNQKGQREKWLQAIEKRQIEITDFKMYSMDDYEQGKYDGLNVAYGIIEDDD